MMKPYETLIFDVNETLLDLKPLSENVNIALGNDHASEIWFSQLLHYSLVESITNVYHDFSEIAAAVFKMQALKHDRDFSENEIKQILQPINELKAYPDVNPGLEILKNAGYQLVAFSNGKPEVLQKQITSAGLESFFDKILSVEKVKRYKPHPDAYRYTLDSCGIQGDLALMVAAHAWDITGAQRAGLKSAFIQRPGKFLFPLAKKPDHISKTIEDLARELT